MSNDPNYRWIKLAKHCEITGDTPDAVQAHIVRGRWKDGIHFRRDETGDVEVCVQAYNEWVEHGSKPGRPIKTAAEILYRHFDKNGALLYIGISSGHFARLAQHVQSSPWVGLITTVTLEHFPDRASVRRAELAAIRAERPIYNIKGKP